MFHANHANANADAYDNHYFPVQYKELDLYEKVVYSYACAYVFLLEICEKFVELNIILWAKTKSLYCVPSDNRETLLAH